MKLEWASNQNEIRLLMDKLISHFRLNDKGQVSMTMGWEIYSHTLFRKIKNKSSLAEKTLYELFEKAVRQAFKEDTKIKRLESVLEKFNEEVNFILNETKKYALVTTLSIKKSTALKSRIINDTRISFYSCLPKKYSKFRVSQLSEYLYKDYLEPDDYVFVVVTCEGNKDHRSSVNKMLKSLDLYRGLLELCLKNHHNFFADKDEFKYPTTSGIKLGEYHTLHTESGAIVTERVWYQQNYKEANALSITDISKLENVLAINIKWLKNSSLKYREHVMKSISLYIIAIDLDDAESRFLKLWTAIEVLLVNCDKEAALTERISFRYSDRSTVKLILSELRKERNEAIHKGIIIASLEYKVFILKDFAEDIFRFFIKNPFNFKAPQHVVDFFHLPTDPKEIDEKIRRLKLVKKFINSN
jgi:hypothetical protein